MNRPLLTIASGNPRKVAEIEAMLGPLPIKVQRQPDNFSVEETGSTYLENAILKAKAVSLLTKNWLEDLIIIAIRLLKLLANN